MEDIMSGLFISQELRKARREIRKTQDDVIKISNELYEIVKADVNKAQSHTGRDYITYTADRKIGKTYTLMKLAVEYNLPIIVHTAMWGGFVQKEAKKLFNADIVVRSYRTIPRTFDGLKCGVILKEEMVDISVLRDVLSGIGYKHVNIVGFN